MCEGKKVVFTAKAILQRGEQMINALVEGKIPEDELSVMATIHLAANASYNSGLVKEDAFRLFMTFWPSHNTDPKVKPEPNTCGHEDCTAAYEKELAAWEKDHAQTDH